MSVQPAAATIPPPHSVPREIKWALLALVVIGVGLATAYVKTEAARDLNQWQHRLNLVAEDRAAVVSGWVAARQKELAATAENPSLQMYLTELQGKNATSGQVPQQDYLRSLLTAEAAKLHMVSPPAEMIALLGQYTPTGGGIALLGKDNRVIATSEGMPALSPLLLNAVSRGARGESRVLDVERTEDNHLRLGFVVPVFGIQADHDAAGQVGTLVAFSFLGQDFFDHLQVPAVQGEGFTTHLVRASGGDVQYLSAPNAQVGLLTMRLKADDAMLDAAFALTHPGDFGRRQDYAGRSVLVTGRTIAGTPWSVVTSITEKAALSHAMQWRVLVASVALLFVASVVAGVWLTWHYGVSRRMGAALRDLQRAARDSAAQVGLLELVADYQPDPLYIVDTDQRFIFANRRAREMFSVADDRLIGMPLAQAVSPALAASLVQQNHLALASQTIQSHEYEIERDEHGPRSYRAYHVPLSDIPGVAGAKTKGVLVVEQDVTQTVRTHQKRSRSLQQLVDTLVSMVDERDPFAARHSTAVATLARAIAEEMSLTPAAVRTTEIAARLMNIGKIDISADLLTRPGSISDDERFTIKNSLSRSAEILRAIDFEGPVVETLEQAQERMDGSGPARKKGEDILISARIIAVANALVGMVSPRSYRAPLNLDEACRILLSDMDVTFDRKVVVALYNYLDNKDGRAVVQRLVKFAPKPLGKIIAAG